MTLKLLQLNIFQGIFLDAVNQFTRENNIDILNFQEVTKGEMSKGGEYRYPDELGVRNIQKESEYKNLDCFEEIKKTTNMDGAVVYTSNYISDPTSATGNATFVNKSIQILDTEIIWLKDFEEITPDFTDIPNLSRAALITKIKIDSKELYIINAHLAWGPNSNDEEYKIQQATKLKNFIQDLKLPFILTGDFNVTPETKTASMFDALATNLVKNSHLQNTLNGKIHPAKKLFPPGLAVDYIFTSREINVKSFRLVDEVDLSDHYGLLLEFEV